MKKCLLVIATVVLAIVILIAIFPMLNARLESPKWTQQGQIKSNILFIVSRASYYAEMNHLKSLDDTFKQRFLSDKETIDDLSSASLLVINDKIVDSTKVTYELTVHPPSNVNVTASDGQKFGADILPQNQTH